MIRPHVLLVCLVLFALCPRTAAMDPYRVLGLPRSATVKEIRQRYRHLARKHHPDVNANSDGKAMVEIIEAYSILTNPDRKREHEDKLRREQRRGFGFDFSDLFRKSNHRHHHPHHQQRQHFQRKQQKYHNLYRPSLRPTRVADYCFGSDAVMGDLLHIGEEELIGMAMAKGAMGFTMNRHRTLGRLIFKTGTRAPKGGCWPLYLWSDSFRVAPGLGYHRARHGCGNAKRKSSELVRGRDWKTYEDLVRMARREKALGWMQYKDIVRLVYHSYEKVGSGQSWPLFLVEDYPEDGDPEGDGENDMVVRPFNPQYYEERCRNGARFCLISFSQSKDPKYQETMLEAFEAVAHLRPAVQFFVDTGYQARAVQKLESYLGTRIPPGSLLLLRVARDTESMEYAFLDHEFLHIQLTSHLTPGMGMELKRSHSVGMPKLW